MISRTITARFIIGETPPHGVKNQRKVTAQAPAHTPVSMRIEAPQKEQTPSTPTLFPPQPHTLHIPTPKIGVYAIYNMISNPGSSMRTSWKAKLAPIATAAPPHSPASVIPLTSFDWALSAAGTTQQHKDNTTTQGKETDLMWPRDRARVHPAGLMLFQYARDGCPVDVKRQ